MAEFSQNKYCQGPWIEEQTIINTNNESIADTKTEKSKNKDKSVFQK